MSTRKSASAKKKICYYNYVSSKGTGHLRSLPQYRFKEMRCFMPPAGRHGPMSRGFLTEEEKASQPKVTPALLKRIFSYLSGYKLQLCIVIICIAASSFLSLMPSILTGKILDDGLLKQDLRACVLHCSLSCRHLSREPDQRWRELYQYLDRAAHHL